MQVTGIISLVLLFTFTASCAPSEPELASVSSSVKNSDESGNASALVDYGGAQIGDAVFRANAQSCIESGKFFDRRASQKGACTVVPLARVVCREDNIKKSMNSSHRTQFEKLASSRLSGYLFDQCIDCAAKSSRKTCVENSGIPDVNSGILVTFVKESSGSTDVQTVFVPK